MWVSKLIFILCRKFCLFTINYVILLLLVVLLQFLEISHLFFFSHINSCHRLYLSDLGSFLQILSGRLRLWIRGVSLRLSGVLRAFKKKMLVWVLLSHLRWLFQPFVAWLLILLVVNLPSEISSFLLLLFLFVVLVIAAPASRGGYRPLVASVIRTHFSMLNPELYLPLHQSVRGLLVWLKVTVELVNEWGRFGVVGSLWIVGPVSLVENRSL